MTREKANCSYFLDSIEESYHVIYKSKKYYKGSMGHFINMNLNL